MHSDSWVDVPYEECPPDVQSNIRVISRMDAFHASAKANSDALATYVEGLYQGSSPVLPVPVAFPSIDDEEMEFMMEQDIKDSEKVAHLMRGDDAKAVDRFLEYWSKVIQRKTDYLAYNRKALEKRYRRGADQTEIDRVKQLISEGESEIAYLQPRIEWAKGFAS